LRAPLALSYGEKKLKQKLKNTFWSATERCAAVFEGEKALKWFSSV